MNDLDLLMAGAMVTFLSVAGAYVTIRHRANELPVDTYEDLSERPVPPPPRRVMNGSSQSQRDSEAR